MNIPKTQYLIIWANFPQKKFTWKMGIFSEPHNIPNNTYRNPYRRCPQVKMDALLRPFFLIKIFKAKLSKNISQKFES